MGGSEASKGDRKVTPLTKDDRTADALAPKALHSEVAK
jgi:hypothetical protein